MPRTRRAVSAIAATTLALSVLTPLSASAAAAAAPPDYCYDRNNSAYHQLLGCMTLDGVLRHMEKFQEIASKSDDPDYPGSRAAGTDGYADSVEYVAGELEKAAGLHGHVRPRSHSNLSFQWSSGSSRRYEAEYPSGAFTGSSFGTMSRVQVIPVDMNLTPPGCPRAAARQRTSPD